MMRGFRDFGFTANHVAWLLVVIAMIFGGLLALQGNNMGAIGENRRSAAKNAEEIARLDRELSNLRRTSEDYQREQRQNVVEFSDSLRRIERDQLLKPRSGSRK